MKYHTFTVSALVALAVAGTASAGDDFIAALKDGTVNFDARYRYEYADQANLPLDANASTLRTRIGYTTGDFHDFSGTLEFENITQIGDDNYNNTLNGKTNRPVVADPESTNLNQAYLTYKGIDKTKIYAGRKTLNLDGQRFIGSVDWRQNDQTLDGVGFNSMIIPGTEINYMYVSKVNRIFGRDSAMGRWDSDSHIINVSNNSLPIGKITAYGYLLDFQEDAQGVSSQTYGASLKGKQDVTDALALGYHLEYARQSDYGDNPTQYDADYYHIVPSLSTSGFTFSLGYEVLGSDNGNIGFSTPLATAHKFNGFADLFLGTPQNGLEDKYVDVTYKFTPQTAPFSILKKTLVKFQYHEFESNEGGQDFGTEFDAYVKVPLTPNYYVGAKYANFEADDVGTGLNDTERFMFSAGVKF